MDVQITQETCCAVGCGVIFWMTTEHFNRLQSTKREFFCLNGHSQHYTGESDKTKAIRLQNEKTQLEREKQVVERALAAALKKNKRKPRKNK